jgi:Uma2 family endonuclease
MVTLDEPRVLDRLSRRIIRYDRPLTRADFERLPPLDGKAEVLDGVIVQMSPNEWHGTLQAHVGFLLKVWDIERASRTATRRGRVVTETNYPVVAPADPERSRAPDVAYTRPERLIGPPVAGHPRVPPDLAVEVKGLYTDRELDQKIAEYVATGIPLIWVLDPRTRTALVYRNSLEGLSREQVGPGGLLDGGEAVPGLRLPLADVFGVLDDEEAPDVR